MESSSDELTALAERLRQFAAARDWTRFHTPKNLAMALSVEVSELCELFQWLTAEESLRFGNDPNNQSKLEDELADIFIYLILLADVVGVDLFAAANEKVRRNDRRFPRSGFDAG